MNLNDIIRIEPFLEVNNYTPYEEHQLIYDTVDSCYIPIISLKSLREYILSSSERLVIKYFLYPFIVPNEAYTYLHYIIDSSGRTYNNFLNNFFKRGIYRYSSSSREKTTLSRLTHRDAVDQKDLYFYSFHGGIIDAQNQDFLLLLTVNKNLLDLMNKDNKNLYDYSHYYNSYFTLFINKKLLNNPSYKNLYRRLKRKIIDIFFTTGINITYTESIIDKLSRTSIVEAIPKLSGGSSIKLKKVFEETFEEIKKDVDDERERTENLL